MAWTSGFFNSQNNDRLYTSDQISAMFRGLITDGVYESIGNKLAVQPNSSMTIQINTGRGYFFDKWVDNDSPYLIALEGSDVTLNRYVAVGVRVNTNVNSRTAEPFVKYSGFATNPVKPTPERSENIKEYILAYVYIKAGVTSITASAIEDTRANTELCGWVTGLIKQIDANTLFEQYDAIFKEWFNSLSDYLDENAEVKLANDVLELQKKVVKYTGTIKGDGWALQTDNTYLQLITVSGINPNNIKIVIPDNTYLNYYKNMGCRVSGETFNTLIFDCNKVEVVDIPVEVIEFSF